MKPLDHSKSSKNALSCSDCTRTKSNGRTRSVVCSNSSQCVKTVRPFATFSDLLRAGFVRRACPRNVAHCGRAGMQTDEKPWLRSGDAPFHNYFLERIWKGSSCHRGPGKKFDGDCRTSPDPTGVARGDLRAMYDHCRGEQSKNSPIEVALAMLRNDDQRGAKFGTDANGASVFNVWVHHREYQPVVGLHAASVLKAQRRQPITDKMREDAWHYWHAIVIFPPSLGIPAVVRQTIFTHPNRCVSVWLNVCVVCSFVLLFNPN